jgi:hypothetical protein
VGLPLPNTYILFVTGFSTICDGWLNGGCGPVWAKALGETTNASTNKLANSAKLLLARSGRGLTFKCMSPRIRRVYAFFISAGNHPGLWPDLWKLITANLPAGIEE